MPVIATPLTSSTYPADIKFSRIAAKLINKYIPTTNASWFVVSNNPTVDPNKPYIVGKSTTTEYDVKILFVQDDLEDRQFLRYRKSTTVVDGQVNGYMLAYNEFEPKLKDVVNFGDERLLTVNAIDPIQPIDKVLLYFIEFGS